MAAVFLDYDQAALDAAYDQAVWAPNRDALLAGYAARSAACRERLGPPLRFAYGPTPAEGLELFRAAASPAPVLIFVHGGAWRGGAAADYAFPAELFVAAGVHYAALDFAPAQDIGGDLRVMAAQVQRAILWLHGNAARFGGDPDRLYLAGHSSGAHLAAVAMTADWPSLGAPADILKGGLLASGMYDLRPVRLSARSRYVAFDDEMEARLSPIRHVDRLSAPLGVAWGSRESPEFIRQGRDFAAAATAAGKPVERLVAEGTNHFEMMATLDRADGLLGRAALALIGAAPR
jgi:arylformamidase